MKVLIVMGYPGYLRYYDSTAKLLAERGHEVLISFEQPKKQPEGLCALADAPAGVTVLDAFPRRSVVWDFVPRELRRIADWVRYLDPRFGSAHYLRRRNADLLLRFLQPLTRVETTSPRVADAAMRFLLFLERAVPASKPVLDYIDAVEPDVVVITPLVTSASRQPDIVKAAHRRGIPVVAGIASWDHLSSKGLIRVLPEKVVVWNDIQRNEALDFHYVPDDRIVVTGAQPWDRWFEKQPSTTADEFRTKIGLRTDKHFVLFVGSTASISAPEAELEFVREWVTALRASEMEDVRDLGVLVRPHPYNPGVWRTEDMSDLGNVTVWPRAGANPVDEDDRQDYFDSMYHASCVVGINTSAMMESAIVGRPVFTVRAARFDFSQAGTVHFGYLLPENGGFVSLAQTLEEHVAQLEAAFRHPEEAMRRIEGFLERFVRPYGSDVAGTPLVVDAIEDVGLAGRIEPTGVPRACLPVTLLLWLLSILLVPFDGKHRARLLVIVSTPLGRRVTRVGQLAESASLRAGWLLRRVERLLRLDRAGAPLSRVATAIESVGVRLGMALVPWGGQLEAKLRRTGKQRFAEAQERNRIRRKRTRAKRGQLTSQETVG